MYFNEDEKSIMIDLLLNQIDMRNKHIEQLERDLRNYLCAANWSASEADTNYKYTLNIAAKMSAEEQLIKEYEGLLGKFYGNE